MKFAHPSIAAFRGVATELFPFALIYDWGENDTIMEYVKLHPEVSRLTLVPRFPAHTNGIIQLTRFPTFSCYKLRGVCNTFIRLTFHMEI